MINNYIENKWFVGDTPVYKKQLRTFNNGLSFETDFCHDEESVWISAVTRNFVSSWKDVVLLQADRNVKYLNELAIPETLQVTFFVFIGYFLLIVSYGIYK